MRGYRTYPVNGVGCRCGIINTVKEEKFPLTLTPSSSRNQSSFYNSSFAVMALTADSERGGTCRGTGVRPIYLVST
jgi:hypothetical protein